MTLLWIRTTSAWDTVAPEAQDRRMDRVRKWVEKQPHAPGSKRPNAMEIPDHFADYSPFDTAIKKSDSLWSQGDDLGMVHTHHLPEREVRLDGTFHITQPTVDRDILRDKINQNRHSPGYDGRFEGFGDHDEHIPTEDPLVVHHQGHHYLLDGHHRFVEHRLLGKPTMWARVFDADDPREGPEHCHDCQEHKRHCWECGGDDE